MIYEYQCPSCSWVDEIVKSVSEIDREESCTKCGNSMERRISLITGFNLNTVEPHFNHGLGKKIHNRRQITEELARIKGETGREIHEVGNDRLTSVKKQKKDYMEGFRWGDYGIHGVD